MSEFWWNWDVQLATAVATFLAVLAALFLDWFRARFFPPSLVLSVVNERGAWCDPSFVQIPGQPTAFQTASRWYHVRVRNTRRWRSATAIDVYLLDYEIPNPAGQYVSQPIGAVPLTVRNEPVIRTGRVVGPEIEWNLCSVWRENGPGGSPLLRLHPVFAITNMTVKTHQPFTVRLTLEARSIEVDSNRIRVKINWNGQWDDDETRMANHLRVTQDSI
jgi:hypothetical protein